MIETGKNYFLPLAGADEIGASSYFVKLEGANILLDCGARTRTELSCPNYSVLLEEQLDDYDQLDAICISHAHYDHIGSLFQIASQAKHAKIYATKVTKELIRLQLVQFGRSVSRREPEKLRMMKLQCIEKIIDGIIEVAVKKPFMVGDTEITFFAAGHMAGACMIGLSSPHHKLLYTGDFSFNSLMGMNEMNLAGFRPDTLILNATHGYQDKEAKGMSYKELEKKIKSGIKRHHLILLKSNSIPKHLDLFYALKSMKLPVPCYLHPSSEKIAEAFSVLNYKVYTANIKDFSYAKETPQLVISSENLEGYRIINVDDYSLHASLKELILMVYMCMPKQIFVVHTREREANTNLFMELEEEGRYHGQILQCHNEETYPIL